MTQATASPPPLEVSDSAARRIGQIVAAESEGAKRLRISVSGGGCSGFQYGFALDDGREEEGDIVVRHGEAEIVVDGMSLMYVLGSRLDFVENLTGSYFEMKNPNAASGCGCGASFSI